MTFKSCGVTSGERFALHQTGLQKAFRESGWRDQAQSFGVLAKGGCGKIASLAATLHNFLRDITPRNFTPRHFTFARIDRPNEKRKFEKPVSRVCWRNSPHLITSSRELPHQRPVSACIDFQAGFVRFPQRCAGDGEIVFMDKHWRDARPAPHHTLHLRREIAKLRQSTFDSINDSDTAIAALCLGFYFHGVNF